MLQIILVPCGIRNHFHSYNSYGMVLFWKKKSYESTIVIFSYCIAFDATDLHVQAQRCTLSEESKSASFLSIHDVCG